MLHSGKEQDGQTRHQPKPFQRFKNYSPATKPKARQTSLPLYHNPPQTPKDPEQSLPMSRHETWQAPDAQQPLELGKRRKRSLAGKVRATVSKPARAVGRRVFKRYGSTKISPLEAASPNGNGILLTESTEDDFRGEDSSSSILRRSLSRMMSTGSVSRPATKGPGNNAVENAAFGDKNRDDTDVHVRSVEAIARNVALLFGSYVLGASHPEYSKVILRLLEFIVTAWLTCLLILGLSWMRKSNITTRNAEQEQYPEDQYDVVEPIDYEQLWRSQEGDPEMVPLVNDAEPNQTYGSSNTRNFDSANLSANTSERKQTIATRTALESGLSKSGSFQDESVDDAEDEPASQKQQERKKQYTTAHPALNSLYVIDASTGERLTCNNPTPHRISNEWVEIDMLSLIRTPDADDPNGVRGSAYNDTVSDHFRPRARRFEFQYQVKLKKIPTGKQLYFAAELDEPIKMGIVTKAFVSAAMAFVKATNPFFHYNITGSKTKPSDGTYETPHCSFTVEGSLDRLVVTKPGQIPPKLGGDIPEEPESIKARKSGKMVDWNTEDTYTMSIWSSYADFLMWRIQKIPGVKPFGLASVIGAQPINLTLYLIDKDVDKNGTHYRKDISEILRIELSNTDRVGLGKEAQKWVHANSPGPENSIVNCHSEDSVENPEQDKHPALGSSETIDEVEGIDNDTADAAELGEGIYLRSGDSIILREFLSEERTGCTVVNGGGFAVLSKQNIPVIIEKTKRSQKNSLIKSGDTVMFKMIQNKAGTDETETRYLTIHRGWWLKWVTTMPSKNGCFTIVKHDSEDSESSFLTLGGSFALKHKRWYRYAVGVSAEASTNFGGRLLSLYNSKRNKGTEEEKQQATYQSEDDGDFEKEMPSIGEVGRIKPLILCAQDPQELIPASPRSPTKSFHSSNSLEGKAEPQTPSGIKLQFSTKHSRADVPAWIELMNREKRVRQLAYVVRIIHRDPATDSENIEAFTRLKCGKNLARIMTIGQKMKIKHNASTRISSAGSSSALDSSYIIKSQSFPSLSTDVPSSRNGNSEHADLELYTSSNKNASFSNESGGGEQDEGILQRASNDSLDYDLYDNPSYSIEVDEFGQPLTPSKLDDEAQVDDGYKSDSSSSLTDSGNARQKRKRVQKLKKIGKKTGRMTKKTAKGLRVQPRKIPRKKNREMQGRVAKKMKRLGKIEAKSGGPPNFIAGEMSATEQSRRTASRILERMTSVPMESPSWQRCNDALVSELGFITAQDSWFLDGDATHLGVKPSKKHGSLLGSSLVARCLWESHWREEWCGMYESSLVFYTPMAKSMCHDILYTDIHSVRSLALDNASSPLPGFPIMVVETAWRCHYVAFRDEVSRDVFCDHVKKSVRKYKLGNHKWSPEEEELRKARFWQGFQILSETSLASGASKWAKVSCNQKSKERAILNGRRMAFDSQLSFDGNISKVCDFVEKLLTMALTFSYTSLEKDPKSFIEFLDMTSELRFLPLDEFDLSSPHVFCVFVNIYHCLLQQALLLSVNGPLDKKSISHFMRTSCYEIGGDVFSLAELHSCVICGKMSKQINPRPPYVEAPRKSSSYKYYALDYTDPRVHFVLNTADMACPKSVPVLSQRYLEQQLNIACVDFFCNKQLFIDVKRRVITMPKVCEIRRNDFRVGEILNIFRACVGEMDESDEHLSSLMREIMEKGEKGLTIKFQPTQDQYHSSLRLTTAATSRNVEMEYDIVESKSMVSLEEA